VRILDAELWNQTERLNVPRKLLLITCGLLSAAAIAACGGDDDDEPTPTNTAAVATPTIAISSPTPAGTQTTPTGAIVIDQPIAGLSVQAPFRVNGTANVFEAVLFVQLLINDEVRCEHRVMASAGTGTTGTWETEIAIPPPPEATRATLRAFSRSPRDGAEENVVTRNINITDVVPPIVIDSPECNTDVQALGTITVEGTASVFEATVNVDLVDINGDVVLSQVATATAGAPERGDWSVEFNLAGVETGAYTVEAYSISARDGSKQDEFIVPVRITT
jgi:hypothetical protein